MHVSPFESEVSPPVDEPPEPRQEGRTVARPAPSGDEGDPRREDTPEEPGYGHGV
jgi:hypothetical protein